MPCIHQTTLHNEQVLIKTAQTTIIEVYKLKCTIYYVVSAFLQSKLESEKARDQGYVLPSYSNQVWKSNKYFFAVMLYEVQLNILDRGLQLSAEY